LTTVEGFLTTTKEHLETALNEGVYDELPEESVEKIKSLVTKLDEVVNQKLLPVKFIVDDPSGNSFIENPYAPQTDPYIKVSYYERTKEMAESMGYMIQPDSNENKQGSESEESSTIKTQTNTQVNQQGSFNKDFVNPSYYDKKKDFTVYKSTSEISAHLLDFTKSIENNSDIKEEALRFTTNCYCCGAPGENYMCLCTIPFFKEIIITCFKCQVCGYKTTEVKGGGGISEKATRYTLNVSKPEDYDRDIFKSETAKITIPELDFETNTGSMGSMFTTVEGVIDKLINNLNETPFTQGDSSESEAFHAFISRLRSFIDERKNFTLIIDDPLSNSFVHSPYYPEVDPRLLKEEYERTWEQNEDLGINDMKVENYQEEANQQKEDS